MTVVAVDCVDCHPLSDHFLVHFANWGVHLWVYFFMQFVRVFLLSRFSCGNKVAWGSSLGHFPTSFPTFIRVLLSPGSIPSPSTGPPTERAVSEPKMESVGHPLMAELSEAEIVFGTHDLLVCKRKERYRTPEISKGFRPFTIRRNKVWLWKEQRINHPDSRQGCSPTSRMIPFVGLVSWSVSWTCPYGCGWKIAISRTGWFPSIITVY